MPSQLIPPQSHVDWKDPEQHCAWALQALPSIAGVGQICHPGMLRRWSKHLVEAGFCHVDYLRTLADENGNINVSQLPKQQIRYQAPFRGPQHAYNPAHCWVPVNTPAPEPFVVQDPRFLTIQEQEAQLSMYREMGRIPDPIPQRDTAEEIYD